ncbi:hypothetical protein ACOMHN_046353 [Nucella lapillus]
MKCRRVPSGHWSAVLTLLMGFCLSVAGVVSPWWHMAEDQRCSSFEGLWQQCSRCWHQRTHCTFSERHTGVWRAVQAVHLLSLTCLTGALLCAATCADKRACTRGKCPTPALAAFLGGLTGLMANLMFVGHTERYVPHGPRQWAYAWSFAMAVAGSLLALLSSLIFCMVKAICFPRYTSQCVEPYWPYNHCQVGLGPGGYPQYYPYPCLSFPGQGGSAAELELGVGLGLGPSSALQKRKLFEQYRHGRVHALTAEEEKLPLSGGSSVCSVISSSSTVTLTADRGEGVKQQKLPGEGRSDPAAGRAPVHPPAYRERERSVQEGGGFETESCVVSQGETQTKGDVAADPTVKETDQSSLPLLDPSSSLSGQGSSFPDQPQAPRPGSPVVVLTLETSAKQPRVRFSKEEKPSIFVVEKAFQDCSRAEGTAGGQ